MPKYESLYYFCKRLRGTYSETKDKAFCEVTTEGKYLYISFDPKRNKISFVQYDGLDNTIRIYHLTAHALKVDPTAFTVCDERNFCIDYNPFFDKLTFKVPGRKGRIVFDPEYNYDPTGISYTIVDCEVKKEDGKPSKLVCNIAPTSKYIKHYKTSVESLSSNPDLLEVGERVSDKLKKKLSSIGVREVSISYLDSPNVLEAAVPGFVYGMNILNELAGDPKFRKNLEFLKQRGVFLIFGTAADTTRAAESSITAAPVGIFNSKGRYVMVSTSSLEVRDGEEIQHTIVHELGHALVYTKAREAGKQVPPPMWKGYKPAGEEEHVERFWERVRRVIPRAKPSLESLKFLQ